MFCTPSNQRFGTVQSTQCPQCFPLAPQRLRRLYNRVHQVHTESLEFRTPSFVQETGQSMVIETCGHLESAELIQLCTFLDANISSLKLTPWITAAFGLLTGLVISWITVIGNRHAQSRERHNNAQRKALLDMQDLALKLRNRWHEHLGYIQEHPNAGAPFSAHEQTALQGEFQTAVTRLDNFYLRKVYLDWEDYAQNLFNGADDHQDFIEEKLWSTTLDRSGANIRWMDG